MNIVRIVIACFFSGVIASACATTSSSSGSNSNWLATCTKDSDCSGGLECRCNACTKGCKLASDCSGLAADAICDTSCSQGACKRAVASPDGGTPTCNDRGNEIQAQYHALLDSTDSPPNKACSVDADCVAAPSLRCSDHCGLPFLSKTGAASLASDLAALEADLCDPFFAAGCPELGFHCPAIGFPKCVAGACENYLGGPTISDSGAGPPRTCDEWNSFLGQRVAGQADQADRTCTTAADCTVSGLDIRCYHGCASGPLSNAGAAALATELTAIEADLCPAFEAAGCVSFVPPCVPPPTGVKCISNICQY